MPVFFSRIKDITLSEQLLNYYPSLSKVIVLVSSIIFRNFLLGDCENKLLTNYLLKHTTLTLHPFIHASVENTFYSECLLVKIHSKKRYSV